MPEVVKRTGLSRSEIYRRIKLGRFPRPRKLGPKVIAWPVNVIELFCQFPTLDNDERDSL